MFTVSVAKRPMDSLKILILAGGHSSRMGSPKHLLPLPDGPLYLHLIRTLHNALPSITTHHISLADGSTTDDMLRIGNVNIACTSSPPTTVILSIITDTVPVEMGPAAGLLAAHEYDRSATWLVIACDYPLLEAAAVSQLVDSYEEPATCFRNGEGFSEPLLGIWSPQALNILRGNVESGRSGPSYTLKRLGSKLIEPMDQKWLTNVNTKQEWEAVKNSISRLHASNGV
jgi:molybdopterin-guanine dinucleotide biosynthesis protein A